MPFTVSHIAAILPLHEPLRRLGLISAAAIGTMVPDLDLISAIHLTRQRTHGLLALLTFCLPVGLALWALFQALIKPALIEVLPNRIYDRVLAQPLGPRLGSAKVWLYAAVAILLGAGLLPARERHRWMAIYILIPVVLVALMPINQNGWRRFDLTEALTLFVVTGMRGTALGLVFTSALIRRRMLTLAGRAHRV